MGYLVAYSLYKLLVRLYKLTGELLKRQIRAHRLHKLYMRIGMIVCHISVRLFNLGTSWGIIEEKPYDETLYFRYPPLRKKRGDLDELRRVMQYEMAESTEGNEEYETAKFVMHLLDIHSFNRYMLDQMCLIGWYVYSRVIVEKAERYLKG